MKKLLVCGSLAAAREVHDFLGLSCDWVPASYHCAQTDNRFEKILVFDNGTLKDDNMDKVIDHLKTKLPAKNNNIILVR